MGLKSAKNILVSKVGHFCCTG